MESLRKQIRKTITDIQAYSISDELPLTEKRRLHLIGSMDIRMKAKTESFRSQNYRSSSSTFGDQEEDLRDKAIEERPSKPGDKSTAYDESASTESSTVRSSIEDTSDTNPSNAEISSTEGKQTIDNITAPSESPIESQSLSSNDKIGLYAKDVQKNVLTEEVEMLESSPASSSQNSNNFDLRRRQTE